MDTGDIYLDGHATTPLAPEARSAMEPWWHDLAANPNSPHLRGMKAADAIENARQEVASLAGVARSEIVFTSGATEANNIAILGVGERARMSLESRREIVVSAIEHKSVLTSASALERRGFKVKVAPVSSEGVVNLDALERLVSERTLLIGIMAVNNEVGSIQPINQIVEMARRCGALIHVDAAQAVGRMGIDLSDVDFASISSHKMYGPVGVGALFVSATARNRLQPIAFGGDQEGGLRPGTVPTPLVVGFGEAARLASARISEDEQHAQRAVTVFLDALVDRQVRFTVNVHETSRIAGSLSLRFSGTEAHQLIAKISREMSISEGSACNNGNIESSHVLRSMGFSNDAMKETIRLYFSRYNSIGDASRAAEILARALR